MSAYDKYNIISGVLGNNDKQKELISSVFGTDWKKMMPSKVSIWDSNRPAYDAQKTADAATQATTTSFQNLLNTKKAALEKQRTDDIKMAKYNALGNLLTSLAQPIGWGVGGSTAGVQPYDNRQYLESFNRAVKANDELRNIGTMESEYQFKLDEENRQRAIKEAEYQKRRAEELADYKAKRALDVEFGVNQGKTGKALYDDRKTKAVEAWTIHSNGMTLSEYMDSLEAAHPGYFGEEYKPDRETLERIEKQVKGRARKTAGNTGGGRGSGSGSGNDNKADSNKNLNLA